MKLRICSPREFAGPQPKHTPLGAVGFLKTPFSELQEIHHPHLLEEEFEPNRHCPISKPLAEEITEPVIESVSGLSGKNNEYVLMASFAKYRFDSARNSSHGIDRRH